jgi:hypothetical protein
LYEISTPNTWHNIYSLQSENWYTPDPMGGKLVAMVMELDVGIILPPEWKKIILLSGRFSFHVGTITLI